MTRATSTLLVLLLVGVGCHRDEDPPVTKRELCGTRIAVACDQTRGILSLLARRVDAAQSGREMTGAIMATLAPSIELCLGEQGPLAVTASLTDQRVTIGLWLDELDRIGAMEPRRDQ